jgi:hypothetical protein
MTKIIQLKDVQSQLFDLHKNGNIPGFSTGFESLDKFYTVKLGSTTIIYGHPTSGKSQFLFQLLVNLSQKYGFRHLIYSPESGNAAEIFAEIAHVVSGKSFDKRSINYHISEKELYNVIPMISDYFKIIEPGDENGVNYQTWIELTKEAIVDYDIKTSSFDNWNDIEHNLKDANGMISEYLKLQLPKFNRLAKKNNIHCFGVAHARSPQIIVGQKFPEMPRPDEIEGGSVWYAKAMNLLGLHREYIENENGWIQSNDLTIDIKKVKPKIVGKKGRVVLNYNYWENKYYEKKEF